VARSNNVLVTVVTDAGVNGALVVQHLRLMRTDAVLTTQPPAGRDVHDLPSSLPDAEQGPSRPVTQEGARPAREHGSHPDAVALDPAPPDRVHPAIDHVQPLRFKALSNRPAAKPQLQQLPPRNHAVLPIGEFRHGRLALNRTLGTHTVPNVRLDFLTGGARCVKCSPRARYVAVT
jgi:hypothetical protein